METGKPLQDRLVQNATTGINRNKSYDKRTSFLLRGKTNTIPGGNSQVCPLRFWENAVKNASAFKLTNDNA